MANPSQVGEIGASASKDQFEFGTGRVAGGSMPAADRGGERPGDPPDVNLGTMARTATDAVKKQASQLAQDMGEELHRNGESQKERGVDALRRFARAIDVAADELQQPVPAVARSVHEVARQIDGLSENLAQRNVNELIDQAAQLARTQPALFLGGSVVAGFALTRFLWSSGRQDPRPHKGM